MKENIELPKKVKINFNEIGVRYKTVPHGWFIYHPNFELKDVILEHLRKKYNFCVNSMSYKIISEEGVPTSFVVADITWGAAERR